MELKTRIDRARRRMSEAQGALREQRRGILEVRNRAREIKSEAAILTESLSLVDKCLEEKIRFAEFVSDIVTSGLRELFQRPYEFKLAAAVDEQSGVLKGVSPLIRIGDSEFEDPGEFEGDGVQDVISVILRLCAVLFAQTSNLIVADEWLGSLSRRLSRAVDALLESLARELGLQVIMVTHGAHDAGAVYEITRSGGANSESIVRRAA